MSAPSRSQVPIAPSTECAVVPSRVAVRRPPQTAVEASSATAPRETKTAPKKRKMKAKGAKKLRGWGPFQSVVKERSVDFNLTLDVQSLQQEVQNMTTLRDLLRTKTILQRHSPEGSLFHIVKEYFHVFRTGSVLKESGRKRLMDDRDQRAFMHSVMDEEVDVGNGLHGPDVMTDQMIMYSTFLRFIRLTMRSYDIIVAEDSVVITTKASLRFQILRNTIEMIFPHIMGEEWLVAQLVGREVEPAIGLTFYFNPAGKCCKYEVDLDFVGGFMSIVKDPKTLDLLLGRALIADNCMFGVIDQPYELEEEEKPRVPYPTFAEALRDEHEQLTEELNDLQCLSPVAGAYSPVPVASSVVEPFQADTDDFFRRLVRDYYLAFAIGYQSPSNDTFSAPSEVSQHDFLLHQFVSDMGPEAQTSGKCVEDRWRALSECFEVLRFRQKGVSRVEYENQEDLCMIRSSAEYILRIIPHTIQYVFPHLTSSLPLLDVLVGKAIKVPSQLTFEVESDTGLISRIVERMDFVAAMAEILPDRQDLSFVMSEALLTLDGVACYRDVTPPVDTSAGHHTHLETTQSSKDGDATKERTPTATVARTMSIADILGM
ncbi:hypothetical protein BBJ28_00014934 [Nothophytophthora sp. Chile5]|nr:hypothetical protein BBJ28_00014934 [Nothophytophthora sp. Chile5]